MNKAHFTTVFSGKIVKLATGTVILPNGHSLSIEKVIHPGGAAVVILNEDNQICFLKQYRCVFDAWFIELPAGKIDEGEDPQLTAHRELLEETGIIAERWDSLGSMVSSPGIFTERVHLYLARKISQQKNIEIAADEVFETGWMPLEEAYAMAMRNEITDAKSIIAISRARYFLQQEKTGTDRSN